MAGVRFADVQSRPAEFLNLTSLTLEEFQVLVTPFEAAFQEHMAAWRLDGKPRTARRFTVYRTSYGAFDVKRFPSRFSDIAYPYVRSKGHPSVPTMNVAGHGCQRRSEWGSSFFCVHPLGLKILYEMQEFATARKSCFPFPYI